MKNNMAVIKMNFLSQALGMQANVSMPTGCRAGTTLIVISAKNRYNIL